MLSRTVAMKHGDGMAIWPPPGSLYSTEGRRTSKRSVVPSIGLISQPSCPMAARISPPGSAMSLSTLSSDASAAVFAVLRSISTLIVRLASSNPGTSGGGKESRSTLLMASATGDNCIVSNAPEKSGKVGNFGNSGNGGSVFKADSHHSGDRGSSGASRAGRFSSFSSSSWSSSSSTVISSRSTPHVLPRTTLQITRMPSAARKRPRPRSPTLESTFRRNFQRCVRIGVRCSCSEWCEETSRRLSTWGTVLPKENSDMAIGAVSSTRSPPSLCRASLLSSYLISTSSISPRSKSTPSVRRLPTHSATVSERPLERGASLSSASSTRLSRPFARGVLRMRLSSCRSKPSTLYSISRYLARR
mmetsp:Transcript_67923/g.175045  ORF Transcript_67923/g.175045 Transcript_67923/m.175045 type:complete len:360 (+) Transcript_67923:2321-3400(+)